MAHSKPRVIVIAGPTASGKSDLAVALARHFHGEVISADSRQVYRGMDIGTGKVTAAERRSVPHHLLDVADPKRQYTVAHFKRVASDAITSIVGRGHVPIVAGGTGFWLDSLVYGQSIPAVKPDPKFRRSLARLSTSELLLRLAKLDPARVRTIDPFNRRRLERALEIIHATGTRIPKVTRKRPYELLYLAVLPEEKLSERIARRLDARLARGMVAEVRRLHARGVSWKRLESFGLEYRWVARHLQGKTSRNEMRDNLLHDIVRYAKRQFTWLRRNPDVRWVSSSAEAEKLTRQFLA